MEMIKSFRHAGLESFFKTGSKRGIQPAHAAKLARQMLTLNTAMAPEDMNVPGWQLHPLRGKQEGHWSISVNGNWRVTFIFEGTDATLIDYLDYH